MRLRSSLVLAAGSALVLAAALAGPRLDAQAGSYKQVGDIPIGGPLPASWDYLNVDTANKKLYVSHSSEFVVIDLATAKVVGHVTGVQGAHGIAFAPNGRGYSSGGTESKVTVIDLKTYGTLAKIDAVNPDGIMYEPKQREVYAFSNQGHVATVINPATNAVVTTIPLSGSAETGQSDPSQGRVFVNIEDKDAVDVIDDATHKVVATWPLAPGTSPSGMAIDTAAHRLIIGAGPVMVVMDDTNGKVVSTVPICSGTDATWFDPGTQLAFSSCRDGKVTVAHLDSPDKLTVVDTLTTAQGSKTMALDLATHNLYIGGAKPATNAQPSAPGGRRGRVTMDPDSFHVFVFGTGK